MTKTGDLAGDIAKIARSSGGNSGAAGDRQTMGLLRQQVGPHFPGGQADEGSAGSSGGIAGADMYGGYGYDPYLSGGYGGVPGSSQSGGAFSLPSTTPAGTPAPGGGPPTPTPGPAPSPTDNQPPPRPPGGLLDWLLGAENAFLNLIDQVPGTLPLAQSPGTVLLPGTVGAQAIATSVGWFGDASDGDHTVAGTETLTRDVYYNTLTVPVGTTIKTNGWMIFAYTLCQVDGTIDASGGAGGAAAAGPTAGAAGAAAYTGTASLTPWSANVPLIGEAASAPGKVGRINGNGWGGEGYYQGLGVDGTAGNSPGATVGGAAGTLGVKLSTRDLFSLRTQMAGSAGSGSSGANGATAASGGSGGSGGRLQIAARRYAGTGTIRANGGAGGAGWTAGAAISTAGSEASPGGPGGVVVLIYKDDSFPGTIQVNGGAHPWGGTSNAGIALQLGII